MPFFKCIFLLFKQEVLCRVYFSLVWLYTQYYINNNNNVSKYVSKLKKNLTCISLKYFVISFVFQGCWRWLWCLLHHCWWEPHQLPHLQQTLKPRNCKFTTTFKSNYISVYDIMMWIWTIFAIHCRTPIVLAPTSDSPCWTSWISSSWTRKPSECLLCGKKT